MRIIDLFDKGATLYPDNPAFIDDSGHYSYRQAQKTSHQIAAALKSQEFGKSSHIAVLAPNCALAFLTLLGIFRLGAIWLPINPRNPVAVNADLLARFDGELLLFHSAYAKEAKELATQVPALRKVICIDEHADFSESLQEMIFDAPCTFPNVEFSLDDTLGIFSTGGTTGQSKGVIVTHRNLATAYANLYAHFSYYDNTRHLVVAPMTHTSGTLGCAHFARGGTNVIMSSPTPEGIMQMIEKHQITHLFLPPTVLYMMLAHPNVRQYNYSSLQHFFISSAPCSLEKLKEAVQIFGPVMTETFGQTEAPGVITSKAPRDYLDAHGDVIDSRLGSIGRPSVLVDVAIKTDDGRFATPGEPGEIVVRGDLVSPGYYKNPEATLASRQDGWLHTGDVGVMDHDGFYRIVDRKKDLIITGGFNVYPNEVEQAISHHPAVQECAVIGVPDDKWGEAVKAIVLLKTGAVATADELITLAKELVGSVKAPKSIDFVKDLPRSPVGKVLKAELRKPYWHGRERAVN